MFFVLICEPPNGYHELYGPFENLTDATVFATTENAVRSADSDFSFEVIRSRKPDTYQRIPE